MVNTEQLVFLIDEIFFLVTGAFFLLQKEVPVARKFYVAVKSKKSLVTISRKHFLDIRKHFCE